MTVISDITEITTSCYYTLRPISDMQPRRAAGEEEMAQRQTLIIPMPRQRFPEPDRSPRRTVRREPVRGNAINRDLNSILAFFD